MYYFAYQLSKLTMKYIMCTIAWPLVENTLSPVHNVLKLTIGSANHIEVSSQQISAMLADDVWGLFHGTIGYFEPSVT